MCACVCERHRPPVLSAASPRCPVRVVFFCGCGWSLKGFCCGEREGSPCRLSAPPIPPSCLPSACRGRGRGGWVGPPRKYLYLFPLCYFSGPQGFIKSFRRGYFGCFGSGFAWLLGHRVIFIRCWRNVRDALYICTAVKLKHLPFGLWGPTPVFTHLLFYFKCSINARACLTHSYGVSGDVSVLTLLQGVG